MDQRICIQFCVKNEIKCSEVCKMLTVNVDGREHVEDDERPGRPSTSRTDENVKKVKEMVMNNRRITIREVADDIDISVGSCHEIFSDVLGMKCVPAKFVPKLLNFE